jgi:hypothetical protein
MGTSGCRCWRLLVSRPGCAETENLEFRSFGMILEKLPDHLRRVEIETDISEEKQIERK